MKEDMQNTFNNKKRNSVLAVVVTYNRLELLKRCISALLDQTNKNFDILIVNNGSTDGTKEWVDSLPKTIVKLHQENLGGAGGFYAGQKYAMDNGYDWVWMMDDDGVPDKNQLEELINASKEYNLKIAGPIVANIDLHEEEAFYPGSKFDKAVIEEDIISSNTRYVCPFNGIFLHRSVMDTIGLIKKELYIWGDEREYTLRWRNAGYKEYAVLKAVHYHPQIKSKYDRVFPWTDKYKVIVKPKKFTRYFYRNNGYINKRYGSIKTVIGEFIAYALYFLRRLDIPELSKFVKSYMSGLILK